MRVTIRRLDALKEVHSKLLIDLHKHMDNTGHKAVKTLTEKNN